jgi:GNAT superfamily N-acetyltransferase
VTVLRGTRTYLELAARDVFAGGGEELPVVRVTSCPPAFYRFLYATVGAPYHWVERLPWTDAQIRAHLAQPGISLWVYYADGAPGGYFELKRDGDGSVEIAYFGLLGEFVGRGLGRRLLATAVARAWDLGARRIWLHTCTFDHPAALPNYLRRGFRTFMTEEFELPIDH